MEQQILILNGSPRAPISNSKAYAEQFMENCGSTTMYDTITAQNHEALYAKVEQFSDVLLVFPLYVDSLPTPVLSFLKEWEAHLPNKRPIISVMINCGFLEYAQNDVAIEMVKLFCKRNGFPFGSSLQIGSGEAILNTPFRFLVNKEIKKLAKAIINKQYRSQKVTMPLPTSLFVKASTKYWIAYGEKNGVSEAAMRTMDIEET